MTTAHFAEVSAPDRFISITRARLIARYRMHTIPGRPEELETNAEPKCVVSFAFSGGEMRIRKHGGLTNREWVDSRDFRLRDGWLSEVYEYLDSFLGYLPTGTREERLQAKVRPTEIASRDERTSTVVRPRPIRDNPQA
jgi:hypothetical protein